MSWLSHGLPRVVGSRARPVPDMQATPDEPLLPADARNVLQEHRYPARTSMAPSTADARTVQAVTAILSAPVGRSKRKRNSSSHHAGTRQAWVSSQWPAPVRVQQRLCAIPSSAICPCLGLCTSRRTAVVPRRLNDSPCHAQACSRHLTRRIALAASLQQWCRVPTVPRPQTR